VLPRTPKPVEYNEISRMKRYFVLFTAVAATLPFTACKHTPPVNVAAEVNGHAITNAELDKIYQSQYPQSVERSNEDQVMSNKLEVLNSMITNEIMLQRAEKLGLTAVDADVEAELNKM
jgi:peptidyl-prolyl cis-trans isomerase SurA